MVGSDDAATKTIVTAVPSPKKRSIAEAQVDEDEVDEFIISTS